MELYFQSSVLCGEAPGDNFTYHARNQPLQNILPTQPRDYTSAVSLTSVTSDTSQRYKFDF